MNLQTAPNARGLRAKYMRKNNITLQTPVISIVLHTDEIDTLSCC